MHNLGYYYKPPIFLHVVGNCVQFLKHDMVDKYFMDIYTPTGVGMLDKIHHIWGLDTGDNPQMPPIATYIHHNN